MDEGGAPGASQAPSQPVAEPPDPSTTSFRIIALAGQARSLAMRSIRTAQSGDFTQAEQLLGHSQELFRECHDIQTQALSAHARGEQVTVDILLVHAQDHLSMANVTIENARIFIDLYRALATRNDPPHASEE
ncbi:MAG: PTS lactose/cellobiose transporter subunit IIA [Propionibacterium sp.]